MNAKSNMKFFGDMAPIGYRTSPEPGPGLSFRHYRPEEMVLGKRMEDHLRFAICYWHNFCYAGSDPFGLPTMTRPWMNANTMDNARLKAEAAFEMFALLDVPFFCFHDRDAAPEGENFHEADRNLWQIAELFAQKMGRTKLLWGTANLFSHPRYQAGAATNPDLDVFRMACAQVKTAMEVTHQLHGENYVLWGGREGYETLLNTDLKRELDQLGRFLCMVVEHKHKIGFKGTLLVEPKPQEPTKHQYDFDVSTVFGALQRWGLEKEVKVNIEVGHAFLANHSFEHEVAAAMALGIFGSIDANRNDTQSGWDTDQFPNNVEDLTLAFYHLLKGGGFTTGGVNFDAKLRRQSIDPADLLHGHIGGMDTCACALKAAARLIESAALENHLAERYRSWQSAEGQAILRGSSSLAEVAAQTPAREPTRVSGQQEYLENLVQRAVLPG